MVISYLVQMVNLFPVSKNHNIFCERSPLVPLSSYENLIYRTTTNKRLSFIDMEHFTSL